MLAQPRRLILTGNTALAFRAANYRQLDLSRWEVMVSLASLKLNLHLIRCVEV